MYHSTLYDQGVRYFPYLAIEHYLKLPSSCSYIYIVDNHFFEQEGNQLFKRYLYQHGNIKALIVLPPNLFLNPESGKSILILNRQQVENKEMAVFILPNTNETTEMMQVIHAIELEIQ